MPETRRRRRAEVKSAVLAAIDEYRQGKRRRERPRGAEIVKLRPRSRQRRNE